MPRPLALRPLVSIAVLALAVTHMAVPATAGPTPLDAGPTTIRLSVETLEALDDIDIGSDADFFARVSVAGEAFTSPEVTGDLITPGWEFSTDVLDVPRTVGIVVDIWDEDDFFNGGDDRVDVTAVDGRGITLQLDPVACTFTGTSTGACDQAIVDSGTSSDRARIVFRVEVDEPATSDTRLIRCTTTPVWPQPGEALTIIAEYLDDALALAPVPDALEIWVGSVTAPAHAVAGASETRFTLTPPAGQVNFGCRVQDDSLRLWSGWRATTVGPPTASAAAVPVSVDSSPAAAIDVVFVADRNSYAQGERDPQFRDAVRDAIRNGYLGGNTLTSLFLREQRHVSFWIGAGSGLAESFDDGCDHEYPAVPFADTIALLHTMPIRDCAPGGEQVFSARATSINVMLHETGHRPFGLADEYCCDGGYFETDTLPNLWEEIDDCRVSAPAIGRSADACREFDESISWWPDADWATSDPASNDLMVDNFAPSLLDERRINWILDLCHGSHCGSGALQDATGFAAGYTQTDDPLLDPVPDLSTPDEVLSKVLIVEARFTGRTTVDLLDSRVEYGFAPASAGNPPLLRSAISGERGQLLHLSAQWHPLWIFHTRASASEFGPTDQLSLADARTGTFIFPLHHEMRTLRLWDIAAGADAIDDIPGDELVAIDVEPAIAEFCTVHVADPDCIAYVAGPQVSPGEPGTARVAGAGEGPVGVAGEICDHVTGDGPAQEIALARDDDFADALAGASLPRVECILFTEGGPDAPLDPRTRAQVDRALVGGGLVNILGGDDVVSRLVANELDQAGYQVRRLEGPTRFETAEVVATQAIADLTAAGDPPSDVVLAYAFDWPDAITAGAWAHASGSLIMLTDTGSLHPTAQRILDQVDPDRTVVVGGTDVVGPVPAAASPNVQRVAGSNRMSTATAIATSLWPAVPASGEDFVFANLEDPAGWTLALAAAPLSARIGGPQLGVRQSTVPPETTAYLASIGLTTPPSIVLLGDLGFISEGVATALEAAVPS